MGRKIFVSYKYADDDVYNINDEDNSTVRSYVNYFEQYIDTTDNIYKGEEDGEDLSQLSEDQIWEKLKDRIYDSTLTIVFISPNMKENNKSDRNQWIPWEISYSLKESSRKNKNGDSITSKTNAMIAVVLPDRNNSYSYYLNDYSCCGNMCVDHKTEKLFSILRKNKFNIKNPSKRSCDNSKVIFTGSPSYIEAVKWDNFIYNTEKYIDLAYDRQDRISEYEIFKEV